MRDIIWTVILIWLIYKIVGIFRSFNTSKTAAYSYETQQQQNNASSDSSKTNQHSSDEVKSALKKHANNDGEYIDYEEIK